MKSFLTPERICSEIKEGKITEAMAIEILISIIEESDDARVRAECINTFEKINLKSERIFKIIENLLISDEYPLVRSAAAKAIICKHLKKGINALKWAIRHDTSPILLKTIFDMFDNIDNNYFEPLIKDLSFKINILASLIGIVPEEARFILDLEALFAKDKKNYKIDADIYEYCKNLSNVKNGEPWLIIINKHIEALNFNYFNWKYIKEYQENINSFSKLKFLDLFLTSIKKLSLNESNFFKIPDSIGLLTTLKRLDLSRNNIKEIPNSIGSLTSLEILNLSHNNISEIPDSLGSLTSLKVLNLSRNNIQKIPESIKNLGSLIELRLNRNNIKLIPDSLKSFLNSLESFIN